MISFKIIYLYLPLKFYGTRKANRVEKLKMKKMKDTIISISITILYILGFLDYGVGLVHSFNKHGMGDVFLGTIVFPWAMYRGIEFCWHDDYSDIDWNVRLTNNMQTCVYFIKSVSDENLNKYELNENLEKFSKKIKDYPNEKKQFLIDGTKNYIQYSLSICNDCLVSLEEYKKNGNFNLTKSIATKKIEIELVKFNLKGEISASNIYI
jgi:hypothetical protein